MNIYRSWHMFKEWIATIWKYSKWTLIPCTYIASQWICCYITTHYDLWRFQSLVGPVSLGVIDQFDIRTFSCNSTAGRGYAALFVCFNSRWFDAHGCNIGLWLGLQGSTSSIIWHPRNTTDWQIFILKSTKQIGLGKCMMWGNWQWHTCTISLARMSFLQSDPSHHSQGILRWIDATL